MATRVPKIRQHLRKAFHNLKRHCSICEGWLTSPDLFIDYVLAMGYEVGLVIERIDKSGILEPGNIHLVTGTESALNRKGVFVLKVTFADGVTQTESVFGWHKITGVSRSLFQQSAEISIRNLKRALKAMGRTVHSVEPIGERWETAENTYLPKDCRLFKWPDDSNLALLEELKE